MLLICLLSNCLMQNFHFCLISLQSNVWQPAPLLNVPRQQLGTGSLGGWLYAVGGSDGYSRLSTVERYSPDSNRWMYVKSLNTSRSGVGVGVLGETMYAMGGYDGRSCLKTVERYDPLVDVWSHVAPTNVTRSFPGLYIYIVCIYIYKYFRLCAIGLNASRGRIFPS